MHADAIKVKRNGLSNLVAFIDRTVLSIARFTGNLPRLFSIK